jgi:hypothetical protein
VHHIKKREIAITRSIVIHSSSKILHEYLLSSNFGERNQGSFSLTISGAHIGTNRSFSNYIPISHDCMSENNLVLISEGTLFFRRRWERLAVRRGKGYYYLHWEKDRVGLIQLPSRLGSRYMSMSMRAIARGHNPHVSIPIYFKSVPTEIEPSHH